MYFVVEDNSYLLQGILCDARKAEFEKLIAKKFRGQFLFSFHSQADLNPARGFILSIIDKYMQGLLLIS